MDSSNSLNSRKHVCENCRGTGFVLDAIPRMLLKPVPAREDVTFDVEDVKTFLLSLLAPEELGFAVTEEVRMKVRSLIVK